MASLDSVKAKIINGMMYVVQNSKENCLLKGVLSGVMGVGMGVSFGVFLGTFEGCHGEMLGESTAEQLKFAAKQTVICTYRRCVNYAATFGILGVVLTSGICWMAKWRGKDDQWNSIISGAIAGGAWGGVAARKESWQVILKQSGKCAVGFVLFGIVMDYVINSFQEKAAWTRHFTPPSVISNLS